VKHSLGSDGELLGTERSAPRQPHENPAPPPASFARPGRRRRRREKACDGGGRRGGREGSPD
jgi:hypothetical protein